MFCPFNFTTISKKNNPLATSWLWYWCGTSVVIISQQFAKQHFKISAKFALFEVGLSRIPSNVEVVVCCLICNRTTMCCIAPRQFTVRSRPASLILTLYE